MDRCRIGEFGEAAAGRYLEEKGYLIKERNFRLSCGELDIVAADSDGCLVFVEVKTRKNDEYGFPSEHVNKKKQHHIKQTALLYCGGEVCDMRFDIIEVYYGQTNNIMYVKKINHIEDAF